MWTDARLTARHFTEGTHPGTSLLALAFLTIFCSEGRGEKREIRIQVKKVNAHNCQYSESSRGSAKGACQYVPVLFSSTAGWVLPYWCNSRSGLHLLIFINVGSIPSLLNFCDACVFLQQAGHPWVDLVGMAEVCVIFFFFFFMYCFRSRLVAQKCKNRLLAYQLYLYFYSFCFLFSLNDGNGGCWIGWLRL